MAKIEGNNIYYYVNDHLGSPQKMIDSSGTVVWSADYKPFGETTLTVNAITNSLRFPGQYYDDETGNNYNYYRDYKPMLGRYIQKDPIGLRGGVNLYTYAGNSPNNWIDPYGLFMLSVKYSEKPYGSITMVWDIKYSSNADGSTSIVWNSWSPNFYTSGTRGDNGSEINSGVYKYKYGQHPMNPQNGKNPYPALNLYTRDDNRCISGTKLDKKGKTINENICGVNVHKGYTPKTGSQGCHVIPQKKWSNFISNFESESEGAYVYIRF